MKKTLFILFTTLLLIGCSNDESYNNALQKGLDYIANEEYQKAESAFELALDEKKDDEKATALFNQVVFYQEAINAMENNELDLAKESAEKVIKLEGGSSALVNKSEDVITSINEFQTTLTEVTKEYEEALKHFDGNKHKDAKKIIKNILKKDLKHPIFKGIKEDSEKLQKEIKSVLEAEEKAEEEKRIAEEKEKVAEETSSFEEQTLEERLIETFSPEEAVEMVKSQYGVGYDSGTHFRVVEGPTLLHNTASYMVELYDIPLPEGVEETLFYVHVFADGTTFTFDADEYP